MRRTHWQFIGYVAALASCSACWYCNDQILLGQILNERSSREKRAVSGTGDTFTIADAHAYV